MNLIVNPPGMTQEGYAAPPLGLLYLATMTDTVIFDAAIEKESVDSVLRRFKPRVVGVPIYTPFRHDSLKVLKMAKEYGAVTVAGGPHVSIMHKQLAANYDFIDHLVIGDGEFAWKQVCEKGLPSRVARFPVEDINSLPVPDWNLIKIENYPSRGSGIYRGVKLDSVPRGSMLLGRGCDGNCTFCSTWWVNGKYRFHTKDWLARHIDGQWQRGIRHLNFQDDCLTANRDATLWLCQVLSRYGFAWRGTTRVDCVDEELVREMFVSGCYNLTFGIESGSPEMLKKINKNTDLAAA
ncbi:MAG: cobalamin-dependent protein, partial [Candidatus Omnitrophota bacterium]